MPRSQVSDGTVWRVDSEILSHPRYRLRRHHLRQAYMNLNCVHGCSHTHLTGACVGRCAGGADGGAPAQRSPFCRCCQLFCHGCWVRGFFCTLGHGTGCGAASLWSPRAGLLFGVSEPILAGPTIRIRICQIIPKTSKLKTFQ